MNFDGYQYLKNLKKLAYNMSQIAIQHYECCGEHYPEYATLVPIFGDLYDLIMCDENHEVLKIIKIPKSIVENLLKSQHDYEEFSIWMYELHNSENLERKSNQLNRAFDELKASGISDENLIKLLMMNTKSRKPAIKEFLKE